LVIARAKKLNQNTAARKNIPFSLFSLILGNEANHGAPLKVNATFVLQHICEKLTLVSSAYGVGVDQ